jgi:hypothetical protein
MNASGKLCEAERSASERRWCGPTALCAITGKSYAEMVQAIETVRGKPFKSVAYLYELQAVLVKLGYRVRSENLYLQKHLPTISQLVTRRTPVERQQFMLALVTHHFVAIQGDEICDSAYTQGAVKKFATLPVGSKWKRVKEYLYIEEVPA